MKMFGLILLCINLIYAAEWNVSSFGKGVSGTPFDVQVADARGDGMQRVYVSSKNGPIIEWTYEGNSWTHNTITNSVGKLALMAIGDGRGDGVQRLYWSEFIATGSLMEATWQGSSWSIDTIELFTVQSLSIFIGDGRDDGVNRLYVGAVGNNKGLWEYSWNGTDWDKIQLTTSGMEGAGEVGDLRNDGVLRIASNGYNLEELSWQGASFASSAIKSDTCWPDPVCLGPLRNDSLNRVIMNGKYGRAEYVYDAGSWKEQIVDNTQQRGDIHIARLKADGKYRLYSTFSATAYNNKKAGPVKEYSWNSSSYETDTVLDAVSGATAMLGSGFGRNDDTARLYAPDWLGGEILEATASSPWVEPEESIANSFKNFSPESFSFEGLSTYSIISPMGQVLVKQKSFDKDEMNRVLSQLPKGLYLLHVQDKTGTIKTKKIIQ